MQDRVKKILLLQRPARLDLYMAEAAGNGAAAQVFLLLRQDVAAVKAESPPGRSGQRLDGVVGGDAALPEDAGLDGVQVDVRPVSMLGQVAVGLLERAQKRGFRGRGSGLFRQVDGARGMTQYIPIPRPRCRPRTSAGG